MKKSFTVHDMPAEERPRERLAEFGPEALSVHELLAIILSRGINGESVMTTSQKLLSQFGSLEGVKEASLEDLQDIKGLGFAKACQLKAAFELARRLEKGTKTIAIKSRQKSISAEEIVTLVKKKISNFHKEHFIVISLNTRSRIQGIDTIFVGTLTSSLIHPREILETVIRRHAATFIIAHNHPSGAPDPSEEDTKVTKLIFESGQIMGITMLDHLIIGRDSYFTFRENETRPDCHL
jgi:DNA repair protein RadC